MSPPRAAAHYVQVFSVSSAAIVADKKKTSLEKNTGYDRRLDCTSFKPLSSSCFEDVPIKQILFHSLGRNENALQHDQAMKISRKDSNGQQHRELIL